jgi:hypothetical protein
MDQFPRAVPWALAAAGAMVALGQSARLGWREVATRRRLRARAARAQAGEARAEALLEQRGFVVVARQATEVWSVRRGREERRFKLRADYLVERGGRRFVVEFKTGREAPSLDSSATRRQLLEYGCAFAVDGVLLVDAEAETVEPVTFHLRAARPRRSRWLLAFLVGFLLGAAAMRIGPGWLPSGPPARAR